MGRQNVWTGRRGSRRLGLLLAALIGLSAVVGTRALMVRAEFNPGDRGISAKTVREIDAGFDPPSIQVSLGSTVIFRWGGETAHDTAAGQSSGQLNSR
jgi:plastocyanin